MNNLKEQKSYLKKWYNTTAEKYDTWGSNKKLVSEIYEDEFEGVKKILDIKEGEKILDVATGTGNYLILAATKKAICYGIDISPKMLEIARKKINKLNFRNVVDLKIGDADKIPYENDTFDWITCIGMFEYYPIEHVKKILIEFKRVLKNTGKIITDFPDINNSKAKEFKDKSEMVNTSVYLYNFDLIEDLIKEHNFSIIKKQIRGFEIQLLLKINNK
ncbi:MAG: methyltransferase domain-containing protein [Candidatus Pacearchaeota archaeon]|nr:methyltransferase domain-containing protein [Candidatus Pacearchaeota archaeon]